MEPDNAETPQNTVEKPKKKREPTPAQLENLAKMRTKKQIQAAARKMLEKSAPPPAPAAPQAPPAATTAPDPADVLRVAEDVKYIREYIAKKAAAKEAKAASRRAVDEETHDDELAKYRAYTAQLRNNLLR